jgi:hypothetical protein
MLIVVSSMLVGHVMLRVAPPWVERARYMTRQARCMWHTLPADFVVYEDHPVDSPLLAGRNASFVRLDRGADCMNPGWLSSGPPPRCPPGPAGYRSALLDTLVPDPGGLVFARGRRTHGGEDRLVAVRVSPGVASFYGRSTSLHAEAFIPAGWRGTATLQRLMPGGGTFSFYMNLQDHLRIFAANRTRTTRRGSRWATS